MDLTSKKTLGWIVIVIGFLFLMGSLFRGFDIWHFIWNLWPLALILLGIYLIANRGRFGGKSEAENRLTRFIGELHADFEGQEVGDRDISLFLGEMVIDLTKARLRDGENFLKVSIGVGEANISVPADFPLMITSQIFAGQLNFDDMSNSGIFPKLDHRDDNYDSEERKLHIRMDGFAGEMTINRELT